MTTYDLKAAARRVPPEQCTATSKTSGQRCRQMLRGGGPCRFHGGSAGQIRRQREARVAAAQARAMFADTHEPRDPGEALAAAAVNADQILRSLQQRVELSGELRVHDLEALRQWLELVSKLSKAVLDAGVAERRVQLAESQGQMVAQALKLALGDLGLDPESPHVLRVMATRLQELTA